MTALQSTPKNLTTGSGSCERICAKCSEPASGYLCEDCREVVNQARRARKLVRFRNCFCGVQAFKFLDGQFLCVKHWQADRQRLLQDPEVTEANIRECNARCEKSRYARLKAAGLCVTCGKSPNYFGCVRCESCQAKRLKLHYASPGKTFAGPHPWLLQKHLHFSSRRVADQETKSGLHSQA